MAYVSYILDSPGYGRPHNCLFFLILCVDFHTISEIYKTRADKCHVSHVAGDSKW